MLVYGRSEPKRLKTEPNWSNQNQTAIFGFRFYIFMISGLGSVRAKTEKTHLNHINRTERKGPIQNQIELSHFVLVLGSYPSQNQFSVLLVRL